MSGTTQSLSEKAREILLAAASSQDGHVCALSHKTESGFSLTIEGRDFTADLDHRSVAAYKSAIEQLENVQVLRRLSPSGELMELTKMGYQLAEQIRQSAKTQRQLQFDAKEVLEATIQQIQSELSFEAKRRVGATQVQMAQRGLAQGIVYQAIADTARPLVKELKDKVISAYVDVCGHDLDISNASIEITSIVRTFVRRFSDSHLGVAMSDPGMSATLSQFLDQLIEPHEIPRLLKIKAFHLTRSSKAVAPLTTVIQQSTESTTMDTPDIFVSHSSRDAHIAAAFTELLKAAFSLRPGQIRCTSLDGHRLPLGVDTEEQLRQETLGAKAFFGIITDASIESAYVLFEIGARWGSQNPLFPILARGAATNLLRGPLHDKNALSLDNTSQVHQIISDTAKQLGIQANAPESYEKYINALVAASNP